MALWPYASDTSRSAFGTENSCYRQEHLLQVTGDMLVIAGDSHDLGDKEWKAPF